MIMTGVNGKVIGNLLVTIPMSIKMYKIQHHETIYHCSYSVDIEGKETKLYDHLYL
jgi:hypothetical protein